VAAIGRAQLVVTFRNGERRVYDCTPLLSRPEFALLTDAAFFRTVRVDAGGYGVSWSDDLDLSEYELWTNGQPIVNHATLKEALSVADKRTGGGGWKHGHA
jgi:hypothetical protein